MDLVGRERELAALVAALERAASGSRQLVLVAGEPGIGKTTLVDAFRERAVAAGATWLYGAAWEDGAPSYWPWTQALRGAGLDVLGPGAPPAVSDRFALYDDVARHLAELASAAPVVVVLEDLHAAGPSTADLLDYVHRATAGAAVLLVATYRPAEVVAVPELSAVVSGLEGLGTLLTPRTFREEEVAAVLGGQGLAADERLVAAVLERTQGNPLFVVHTARGLAAGGSAEETGLPLGLRNALRRQAAVAGEGGADGVLEAAAVLAEELTAAALAATAGADPVAVQQTLDRAVGLRLLRPDGVGHYEFTHALVREAVYDGMTAARAAELHLRAARALEAAGAGPDRLAWHFGAAWPAGGAGGAADAARYARRAGDDAARACAPAEAAAAYLLALTAHDRTPEPDQVVRAELLLALGEARVRSGAAEAGRRAAAEAMALARGLDEPVLLGRGAVLAASGLAFNAVHRDAIEGLREADARLGAVAGADTVHATVHATVVARLAELVAVEDRAEALRLAARAESTAGDLPVALATRLEVEWGMHDPPDALARAQRLAGLVEDPGEAARAAVWVMVFALETGDVGTATAAVTSLERLADRSRQPAIAHLATSRRATLATLRGDASGGLAAAREARDLAARVGLADGEAVAWGQLFAVWRIAGLPADERAAMERTARELAASSPYPVAHDGAVVQMLLEEGRTEEARAVFARCLRQADGLSHDLLRTWSLALLAEDAVALGDREAGARIHAAMAPYAGRFVVAAGAVACLGSASHHLGRLAALLGRDDEARAHLEAAVEQQREAGCPALAAMSQQALEALRPAGVSVESDGGVVTVRLGAEAARLPDSLGLTQLAVLVANPGTEVAATVLAAPAAGEVVPPESGAGEVLDRQALAAYRSRLAEIDAELAEARDWHDDGRADRLEDEREALLAALRGDLGLGGLPRRFTDEAERARVNVTRALRSAIRRIGERAPGIGEHLERCVTTGARCCYDPGSSRAASSSPSQVAMRSSSQP